MVNIIFICLGEKAKNSGRVKFLSMKWSWKEEASFLRVAIHFKHDNLQCSGSVWRTEGGERAHECESKQRRRSLGEGANVWHIKPSWWHRWTRFHTTNNRDMNGLQIIPNHNFVDWKHARSQNSAGPQWLGLQAARWQGDHGLALIRLALSIRIFRQLGFNKTKTLCCHVFENFSNNVNSEMWKVPLKYGTGLIIWGIMLKRWGKNKIAGGKGNKI